MLSLRAYSLHLGREISSGMFRQFAESELYTKKRIFPDAGPNDSTGNKVVSEKI